MDANLTDAGASAPGFKGAERELRRFSGARAVRVSHAAGRVIEAHAHDWPNLTIHLAGGFVEQTGEGETAINGPAAIWHPKGSFHGNQIGAAGLETFGLVFDPAWLRESPWLSGKRPLQWVGGGAALAARELVDLWRRPGLGEEELRVATRRFFGIAARTDTMARPAWLEEVSIALDTPQPDTTIALARRVGCHPAPLARGWRAATGEGIQEAVRRRRVEAALRLIRAGQGSLAEVAAQAGFCDQAHMNRCFRAVLDTTPATVAMQSGALGAKVHAKADLRTLQVV